MALYMAVGLTGLTVFSFWFCINQQITTSLSIATLLFTIAQTIESRANYMDEDMQNAMDIVNRVGNFNFNDEMMVFFKTKMKYDTSNVKKKMDGTSSYCNKLCGFYGAICCFCNSNKNTKSIKYSCINFVNCIIIFKYLVC